MNSEPSPSIHEIAIGWHVRLRDGGDQTWEAFAEWLAADPIHADAYAAVEELDQTLEPLLPHVISRTTPVKHRFPRLGRGLIAASGGLAAALAAGVLVIAPWRSSDRYEVSTDPGQQRIVELSPGSRVVMNGSTRIELTRGNDRSATLVEGQALFQIRHDVQHPFSVNVADATIMDVGTVFDVAIADNRLTVGVAEGAVLLSDVKSRRTLERGQEFVRNADGTSRVDAVATDSIGSWKGRRLAYVGAPLSDVARDLTRLLGIPITVDPAIVDRPFSGSLIVPKAPVAAQRGLAVALDVEVSNSRSGWSMKKAREDR